MNRRKAFSLAALFLSVPIIAGQTEPLTGLYQIVSGTYRECCSLLGDNPTPLPNAAQSFVKLVVDPDTPTATLTFLGADMQSVFGTTIPCPPGDRIEFNFPFGLVFSNAIVFHIDPGPEPYHQSWNYAVTNSPNGLAINGVMAIDTGFCVDVPDRFTHSNVVAVLMPTMSIHISEVEVCWNSSTNRSYQPQYRSSLTTNSWINLGSPVSGNGSNSCITDKVFVTEPQRTYRVLAMP